MDTQELFNRIYAEGKDKIIFNVSLRPLRQCIFIQYTTSENDYEMIPCKISEERYKLEQNYKITMKPMISGYPTTHFYIIDFCNLIENGLVQIR